MYDYIFITLDSSFYKVNLYNELAKKKKIYVIFLCKKNIYRSQDFLDSQKNFEFIYLSDNFYHERNKLLNSLKILKLLRIKEYKKLVLGGWDSIENWLALLLSSKRKNCLIVESSEFESKTFGLKGIIKKIFLKKIKYGLVSGEAQKNLLLKLNFKGEIIKTKGVGILNLNTNFIKNESKNDEMIKKFIFVGGLIPVKNVEQIIRVFNKMPNLELSIVGKGYLEKSLKELANKNIKFLGHQPNNQLNKLYQQNQIFILPSKSEPWGLVVEEALFNGLPVILSNKVGCSTEIIKDSNYGYVYNVENDEELIKKIRLITNKEEYKKIKKRVDRIDFSLLKNEQIKRYMDLLQ